MSQVVTVTTFHGSLEIQQAPQWGGGEEIFEYGGGCIDAIFVTGETSSIPVTSSPSGDIYRGNEIDVRYFNEPRVKIGGNNVN